MSIRLENVTRRRSREELIAVFREGEGIEPSRESVRYLRGEALSRAMVSGGLDDSQHDAIEHFVVQTGKVIFESVKGALVTVSIQRGNVHEFYWGPKSDSRAELIYPKLPAARTLRCDYLKRGYPVGSVAAIRVRYNLLGINID